MERQWIAVAGDRIRGKGNTPEQAARAAEHRGKRYFEVVATPANWP